MSALLKSRKKEKDIVLVQAPQEEQIICKNCGASVSKEQVVRKKYICPKCDYYFRVRTNNRLRMVADEEQLYTVVCPGDIGCGQSAGFSVV